MFSKLGQIKFNNIKENSCITCKREKHKKDTFPVWPCKVLQQTRSVGPKVTGVLPWDLAYSQTEKYPSNKVFNQQDLRPIISTKFYRLNLHKKLSITQQKMKKRREKGYTICVEQRKTLLLQLVPEIVDGVDGSGVTLFELRNRHLDSLNKHTN